MSAAPRRPRAVAMLLLALALRAFHGGAPLLGTNAWRQCDNAAIARNYAVHGYRFLEPRVDWGGDGSGVVQMEFPVYQYAIGLLDGLLGEHDWYGRWISILCSLGAVWCLMRLVGRTLGPPAATWAGFFMATLPLYVYYSRAVMVESAMILGLVGGLLGFATWLEEGRPGSFWAAALGIALAALLKPVALAIGLPLLVLGWRRHGGAMFLRPAVWGFALLVILPAAWWYSWSVRLLERDHLTLMGDWRYGTDKWGDWRLMASWRFWNRVLFQRLAEKHLTWPGFGLLALGCVLPRPGPRERVWLAWLAAAAIASALMAQGAFQHEHYQLWFIPPAAALMGLAVSVHFRKKFWASWHSAWVAFCLVAYLPAAGWRYAAACELEQPDESAAWRVAHLLAATTRPGDLVVALDDHDPTDLYHAHRRGWGIHINELEQDGEALLRDRAWRGARYLAAPYAAFGTPARTVLIRGLRARHPVVADDGVALILRLEAPRGPAAGTPR